MAVFAITLKSYIFFSRIRNENLRKEIRDDNKNFAINTATMSLAKSLCNSLGKSQEGAPQITSIKTQKNLGTHRYYSTL